MYCRVMRTIVRCCTYMEENTTYRKSVTTTTQSGWWTRAYARTITSPSPPRLILYLDIISVLTIHILRISKRRRYRSGIPNYHGVWFGWAVKNQWILHCIWTLLLAIIITTLLLYLIPRGIDMLKSVKPPHPKWRTRAK